MRARFAFTVVTTVFLAILIGGARQVARAQDLSEFPENLDYFVAQDNVRIYYQVIGPESGITTAPQGTQEARLKGVLAVFQGLGGGGRNDFQNFGKRLAANGYVVYLVYERGTGYSEGRRGDVKDFRLIIEDYQYLIHMLRALYPEQPLFIFGHSLGGAISVKLAAEPVEELAGVILLNPAYKFKKTAGPSFFQMTAYGFNYLFRSSALTVDVTGDPERIINPKERAEVQLRLKDPLVVKKHSMRYMAGAKKVMDACEENAEKADVPLLLIYGEKDEFVDHEGSEAILFKWRNPDKTRIIIRDGGHGAYMADEVWADVLQWLDS